MSSFLHPSFILILGACFGLALSPVFRKTFYLLLITCSLGLIHFSDFSDLIVNFIGLELKLIEWDTLSALLIYVFHFVGIIGIIFSWTCAKRLEDFSSIFYLAAAVGLVLCGDLFSFYLFWELLTAGAVCLLLSSKLKGSSSATLRYLLFHIVGGLILLAGIVLRFFHEGSIEIEVLGLTNLANVLIFIGIGINAAWPLFHTWVVDAYPKSSVGGAVLLSAFTTKTAAYALIRMFPGEELLVWIGAVMMVFPVFFAVIENNLRRVLSYSLINQVGLIVTAIGIGSELALNGAAAHIVTDIFFKGLLFMSLGAVLYRTGKQHATDLGGLAKYMPLTCIFCIIGAASISAFPFFSGFISKSLIVSGAAYEHMTILWFILLFASAAVLEHAGIKVPFFTFFAHKSDLRPKEAPKSMLIAMGITAFICLALGFYPNLLYDFLPYEMNYNPYTSEHIITQLQLLVFAALAFFLMLLAGIYPPEKRGVNLDVDYFYRGISKAIYNFCDRVFNKLNALTNQAYQVEFPKTLRSFVIDFPKSFFLLNDISATKAQKVHTKVHSGTLPLAVTIVAALMILLIFIIASES